jgi:phage portal protein BeeE
MITGRKDRAPGDVNLQVCKLPETEAEFLESWKFILHEIAAMFIVPPEMLGEPHGSKNV